jgi:type IV pilus assembly protein PilO
MGNFASGIAALPRIVTLHDIEITPAGKDASAGNLVLNVTAKTYRYLDEEEQAPSDAGEKGAKDKKGAKAKKAAKGKQAGGE